MFSLVSQSAHTAVDLHDVFHGQEHTHTHTHVERKQAHTLGEEHTHEGEEHTHTYMGRTHTYTSGKEHTHEGEEHAHIHVGKNTHTNTCQMVCNGDNID